MSHARSWIDAIAQETAPLVAQNAGAINNRPQATLIMHGCELVSNRAGGTAGALYSDAGAVAAISSSVIQSNVAEVGVSWHTIRTLILLRRGRHRHPHNRRIASSRLVRCRRDGQFMTCRANFSWTTRPSLSATKQMV